MQQRNSFFEQFHFVTMPPWVPVMHKTLCFGLIKLHSDSPKSSDTDMPSTQLFKGLFKILAL